MAQFAVYNAKQVSINVAGLPIDSLMAPDEFLRIEKAEDDVSYMASAEGGATLNVTNNKEHTVTIVLQKSSKANLAMSGIYQAGRLTDQGILIVPVVVVDRGSNGDIFATAQAWLKRLPDEAYGAESQNVEWSMGAHDPERFLGGH